MKRIPISISILILALFAAGCSSTNNTGGGAGTPMQGTWNVTGSLGSQGPGPYSYQVTFVSSPCSVASPVGTFSVAGPVCFIANNNSGQGSITGKGLLASAKDTGEGVLIGVSANPVTDNSTIRLLFVLGEANGSFVEFTGSATVANGKMTGTGSCSTNTPMCQGISATFSGTSSGLASSINHDSGIVDQYAQSPRRSPKFLRYRSRAACAAEPLTIRTASGKVVNP